MKRSKKLNSYARIQASDVCMISVIGALFDACECCGEIGDYFREAVGSRHTSDVVRYMPVDG